MLCITELPEEKSSNWLLVTKTAILPLWVKRDKKQTNVRFSEPDTIKVKSSNRSIILETSVLFTNLHWVIMNI